jgi:tetratricopeptide (TPR) repeat protein
MLEVVLAKARVVAVPDHLVPSPAVVAGAVATAPPSIPGCEILGELGRGGMGIVYKARQAALNRLVAVKVLHATAHSSPEQLARFRVEGEAAARLQHPNIVQIYEVGEVEGRPYIVLEFAAGGSLEDCLAGTPLSARRAAELVRSLAQAMDYAHRRGVIHRDLKPSNVVLQVPDAEGDEPQRLSPADMDRAIPKISDFSLAKQLDSESGQTHTGLILGTPSYMAPEQAAGQAATAGPAVDIYALGAILYEALTGRPPFRAATLLETLEQARSAEPAHPSRLQPGLPRDLQTICLKCLEKSPRQRYETAAQLADDLGRFLDNQPIKARPAGTVERLVKWARRRPTAAALTIVSGLSVTSVVLGVMVYNARLREAVHRTEIKEAEARAQQARADANYRDARATLNQMLGRLQDKGIADVPKLRELQQKLLEDALAFYQKAFQNLDDPDPDVRLDVAQAHQKTAYIQKLLGRPDLAAANFQQAIALLESLPDEMQDTLEHQGRLADCCHGLGNCMTVFAEQERWLLKGLELRERASRRRPQDPDLQLSVAISHHHLGALYQVGLHPENIEHHYDQAVTICARLVREHPEKDAYRAQLADSYVNLGLRYAASERLGRAAEVFRAASELLEQLAKKNPTELAYQTSLAALLQNWGNLPNLNSHDALAKTTRAVTLMEALLRQEPRHSVARYMLLNASGSRALFYARHARHQEALKDYDRVVELSEGADREYHKGMRTAFIAHTGDYVRACTEADALSHNSNADGDSIYAMARAYAFSVGKANADTARSVAERARLTESLTTKSLALLARLRKAGYFDDAGRLEHLQTTADLNAVRSRSEYQELLAKKSEARK